MARDGHAGWSRAYEGAPYWQRSGRGLAGMITPVSTGEQQPLKVPDAEGFHTTAVKLGFRDALDMVRLIAAVNLSDPDQNASFLEWRTDDGSRDGLLRRFPYLAAVAR